MLPIEQILERLPDARRRGKGWSAKCPAHDDQNPSLRVWEDNLGRPRIKCHAGCEFRTICDRLGIAPADLLPDSQSSTSTKHRSAPSPEGNRRRGDNDESRNFFPTAEAAVQALERKLGPHSGYWTYRHANGEVSGAVVRWDLPNGKKEIRPISLHPDGWQIEAMPNGRPLFHLPEISSSDRVFVVEGEKAADAARSIELVATTSAGGAEAAHLSDWSTLWGKEVVILPDNDDAGRKYAHTVASILLKLDRSTVVRIVELPGLPKGGDIVEWIEAHGEATEPEEFQRQLDALINATKPFQREQRSGADLRYRPFPFNVLPEPIRGFVRASSKAIGCDPSYVALPLLAVFATAIGNTRRLEIKRGWSVPAILWFAIIGESGTAKTPAFQLALRALRARQSRSFKLHEAAMSEYDLALARYDKELTDWKRRKNNTDDPPSKPFPPMCERCHVSDTTVEALAPILQASPRGVLLARDELAGWIGSFDRYAGGKGSADSAHWLSMHVGEGITVDRKTGNPRTIWIECAWVSVCGGIQPGVLHRALGIEHRESGLAARLLLTCPPRKPKRWTEADIDPEAESEIAALIDRLFELQPDAMADGSLRPVLVGMTPEAKERWKSYYNAHGEEQNELTGELSAAWSKLEEFAARFALVIHFIRWAACDPSLPLPDLVNAESMAAGIALAEWFKTEARRVYSMLGEDDQTRLRRQLIEWIDRRGGRVSERQVQQGCRWLRESGAAEKALTDLVKDELGCWEPVPSGSKGGRSSREFRLFSGTPVNESTDFPDDDRSSVDVDNTQF